MATRVLRIGTRGSRLALEQARRAAAAIDGPSELVVIRTTGDREQAAPLGEQGGVGLFTREIQQALLDRRVDLAVHSLKDLPILHPEGLGLAATMARDEAADLLLVRAAALEAASDERRLPLSDGASVATSSMRRRLLLLAARPDLQVGPIRGNIPTRLRKVADGGADATLLSRAGPVRLGLAVEPLIAFDLNPVRWPGAPGQGVIAIEARFDDREALARVAAADHPPTRACTEAERALHRIDGGGCHSPFGAFAWTTPEGASISVSAPDAAGTLGQRVFRARTLGEALELAAAWLGSGRPVGPSAFDATWLARRAEPWALRSS